MGSISNAFSVAMGAIQDAQSRTADAAAAIADPDTGAFDVAAHVDMSVARIQLQANAVVVRSLNESLGHILDILS